MAAAIWRRPYSITDLVQAVLLSGRISSIDGYRTGNHGSYDILLVCLDSMGVQWSRCYSGSNGDTYSFSIFHLQDDRSTSGANLCPLMGMYRVTMDISMPGFLRRFSW